MIRQFLFNNLWWGENSRERNIPRHIYFARIFDAKQAIVTTILPDQSRVWGIDISHWNGPTDLQTAKQNGCSFVIIKGCDGSVPTRYFQENKVRAKEAGLPWGMYVWLYPGNKVPVGTQVNAWWNLVKDDYPPFYVWIDFEWTYYGGQPANPNAGDLRSALDKFRLASGRRAGVYSAKGYTDQYLTGFVNPDDEMWWVANYGVTTPVLPRGVTKYKLWQFTSSMDGSIAPSQNRSLDGNYYNGTMAEFILESGGNPLPPPPSDVVTHPFPGVTVTRGRRFGTDVQILEMNRDSIASSRAVWGGVGARVQGIAGDIVVNGGDFDQITFRAVGLLVSDGTIFSPQANFEPAFGMWPNGEAEISHMRTSWPNAIGLKRYLVENGQISQNYSDSWNDRAPRTIYCVKADGSPFVFCARGYQDGQAGLSLFDCAAVALEFGAQWAGDGDGGYSTQMKIGNEIFGATTNRYDEVADFWSFTIKGDTTMAYPTPGNYKVIVAEATERSSPQLLSNNDTGRIYHMGDIVEITRVQANVPGVAEWGQLANGNWIATIYNSRIRVEFISSTTPPPPPAGTFTVELTDDSTGEVWKGTLTKQ